MAYRMLSRNQSLNSDIILAIQGKKLDIPMGMQGISGGGDGFTQQRPPTESGL